jgi:large subunit ribosomal protein L22
VAGLKTNERPGTRAVLRHSRMSAYKARAVLDLIRGVDYGLASEILESADRGAAEVIGKLLNSAAANAQHNDQLDPDELYVSACFADEGTTLKRWRPRARGRATRIRKRTCHITVIVSRLPDEEIAKRRARVATEQADRRQRRVAGTRRSRRQGADSAAEVAAADAATQAAALEEATEAAIDAAETAASSDEPSAEVGPADASGDEDEVVEVADVAEAAHVEEAAELDADDSQEQADEPAAEGSDGVEASVSQEAEDASESEVATDESDDDSTKESE